MSKEKILIVTLGKTPEILIKSVKSKNYKKIFVISTDECIKEINKEVKEIAKTYGVKIKYEIVKDGEDPDITFTRADDIIKNLFKKNYKPDDIEINYTGGTKSMSVAVCFAGIMNNIKKQIYIGGERGCDNRVITGREKFYILPLVNMQLSKFYNIIKLLFNTEDFYAAINYIEYLESDTQIKKETDEYLNFLYDISYTYLLWDRMEYEIAAERINKLKPTERIEKFFNKNFIEQLNKNKMILNKTAKSKFFKILDKYAAAVRYFEKGFFLITVEMLYSIAEFIADYILEKEYDLNKQNINEQKAREFIKKAGNEIADDYFNACIGKTDKKIHLSLYNSYDLLAKMGCEIGKKFLEDKEYQETIKTRNNLIHSNTPVKRDDAEKFLKTSKKFIKEFCNKYADDKIKDIDILIENYRFVKL